MDPHCGKCTNTTGRVQAMIMIPMYSSPVPVEYLEEVKKSSCVSPAPKLPPAPVMPEMMPRERRDTNGVTPKMAPQAACTQKEKSKGLHSASLKFAENSLSERGKRRNNAVEAKATTPPNTTPEHV